MARYKIPQNMALITGWQKLRGVTDESMAEAMAVGIATWRRYRYGKSEIPHSVMVNAVNFLHIPRADAVELMTIGIKT